MFLKQNSVPGLAKPDLCWLIGARNKKCFNKKRVLPVREHSFVPRTGLFFL
jgi:hypothetical protein